MEFQDFVPRLDQHSHRFIRLQHEAERTRPVALLALSEPLQDGVHVHRVKLHHVGGQRHGARHLEKAAHPTVGEVDLFLAVGLLARGLYVEAFGIDGKRCRAVTADLLELAVKRMAIVDVRRAVGDIADAFEGLVVAGEPSVGGFVAAEALEEDLVRVHGDDRIEHDPGVAVLRVEPIEILFPRLVERVHDFAHGLREFAEFVPQCIEALLDPLLLRESFGKKLLLVSLEPSEIGGAVFRLEAQVGDDDVMQCRDRLAER